MRTCILVVTLLAGCAQDECPTDGISCSEQGATCHFKEEGGGTASCTCNGATWSCNNCPMGERPVGACEAGQACAVWGFENSCACSCDADGMWSCVTDDADPNFHCSP